MLNNQGEGCDRILKIFYIQMLFIGIMLVYVWSVYISVYME